MTTEQLRMAWPHVRDDAKARWTKLSDDDLDQVQADPGQLVDLLQDRYGYARQIVIAEVNHFLQQAAVTTAD